MAQLRAPFDRARALVQVHKIAAIVQLLTGEIPPRQTFMQRDTMVALEPYAVATAIDPTLRCAACRPPASSLMQRMRLADSERRSTGAVQRQVLPSDPGRA
jgi:hypothetical protein